MENEFHKGRAFQLPVHISIPSMCKEGSVIFHLSRMYPTGWSSQEPRTAEYNPELRREKESQQLQTGKGRVAALAIQFLRYKKLVSPAAQRLGSGK